MARPKQRVYTYTRGGQLLPRNAIMFIDEMWEHMTSEYKIWKDMLLGLGRFPEFLHTQAMNELIPTYKSILNQMVSARVQIIIAVKVSEAVRNNGWDDELRNHVVQRMYKMKDQFTVDQVVRKFHFFTKISFF